MEKLLTWVDERFPLTKVWQEHMAQYYAPKNFNFWYYFGSLAIFVLVIQIVTGIVLTMHYKPDAEQAFGAVEYIMRDVPWGWLIRYTHSTGASFFFIVVYLHMFRALLYGSHRNPRELVWIIGVLIYVALMAESFFGYLLPWGNMSYWGAQVIISLFGAIPFGIGDALTEWIRGDYVVSDATLNRFFAFHVILLPLALAALVYVHIVALHKVGSNNPDGIEIKKNKDSEGKPLDGIPFHPYYTVKDIFGLVVFLILFFMVVFFAPELGGLFLEKDNFQPVNILQTPPAEGRAVMQHNHDVAVLDARNRMVVLGYNRSVWGFHLDPAGFRLQRTSALDPHMLETTAALFQSASALYYAERWFPETETKDN